MLIATLSIGTGNCFIWALHIHDVWLCCVTVRVVNSKLNHAVRCAVTLKMGPFETESSKWEIVARKNFHRFHSQTVLRYYEHNIAIYGSICLLVLKMFVTRDMLLIAVLCY